MDKIEAEELVTTMSDAEDLQAALRRVSRDHLRDLSVAIESLGQAVRAASPSAADLAATLRKFSIPANRRGFRRLAKSRRTYIRRMKAAERRAYASR